MTQTQAITVDALLAEATARTGLNDFGGTDFLEPLKVLVDDLNQAGLNDGGIWAQRERLVNLLVNRAQLEAYFQRYPEIADERIDAPVVIVGLPRTGTTLLHRILSSDTRFYAPLWYEVRYPTPPLSYDFLGEDPRIEPAKAEVAAMVAGNPDLAAIHPFDAMAPDEEIMLLEHSFISTMPDSFAHVPNYEAWVDSHDNRPAYEYLYRCLQALQWQRKRKGQPAQRWLLKTPHHLHCMQVLLDTFPGAQVIQTHRDPLQTIPSIASFTSALWKLLADQVDEVLVGTVWSARFAQGMLHTLAVRERHPEAFLDVQYQDTASRPFAVIEAVYRFVGMDLTEEARAAMEQWRQENRREDRAAHHYTLAQFGLTEEGLKAQFSAYRQHFIEQASTAQ